MPTLSQLFSLYNFPIPYFIKSEFRNEVTMFPALIANYEENTLSFSTIPNIKGISSIYSDSKILEMDCKFDIVNYSEQYLVEFIYMNIIIYNNYRWNFISYIRTYLCKNLLNSDFKNHIDNGQYTKYYLDFYDLNDLYIKLIGDFNIRSILVNNISEIDINKILDETNVEILYLRYKFNNENLIENGFLPKHNGYIYYKYIINRVLVKSAFKK